MWLRTLLCCALTLFCFVPVMAEQVIIDDSQNEIDVNVLSSNDSKIQIQYQINSFQKTETIINNETFYQIFCDGEGNLLDAAAPSLPHINRSIIIPDDKKMNIRIISADYKDFPLTPVAPSKGNLLRTVNPDDIPYTFGESYQTDGFYPQSLSNLREPYILRDYRAQVVEIFPFQYNHVTKTLRVYTNITVEVYEDGSDGVNLFTPRADRDKLVPAFDNLYSHRFINYQQNEKYIPVEEFGDMLIITYDSFSDAMIPLVDWKMQKGIKTTMVNISSIGNNASSIKNFIQNFYDSTNLAWVLLVGDAAQIASPYSSGGSSDPSYVKLAGSDDYPDAFIGRFSAENIGQVETQVARTLEYEMNPTGADWFHKGIGIGSSEGAGVGHYGEADYVHMGYIRDDLLAYNYTLVDEIYDPGASASAVTAGVNNGRSFINYCGHGSTTSWSTTGFSNTNVNALTNSNMFPFIISVACVNGDFDNTTCFGEAWLRATDSYGNPTGAIAAYMSSINQSWTPPMDAQDEITDLLIAESKLTLGGLAFNGSCKTIDINGAGGIEIYDTWHIFGDPSVLMRTDNPTALTVNHDPIVLFTATDFEVTVPGTEGALCAIYNNGVLYGSAYTNSSGVAQIAISEDLPIGEVVTLTVTNYNATPYIADIQVITPSGPYVVLDNFTIDDTFGNNNGRADLGETVTLGMQLINVGPDSAFGVNATISTTDPYISILDDNEPFGIIGPDNETASISEGLSFDISLDAPDNHMVTFDLAISGTARDTWTGSFTIPLYAPVLELSALAFNDASGNNNGKLDPGETADLVITLINNGGMSAPVVIAGLVSNDANLLVDDDYGEFGLIDSLGGNGQNISNIFTVSADADCPLGYAVPCELSVSSNCGYQLTIPFNITIGDRVVFYYDDFSYDQGWTGLGGTAEWEIGATSANGNDPGSDVSPTTDNAVLGNDVGGVYNNSISSTQWVYSPIIDCANMTGVQMSYYHWLGVESNSYDHAYFEVFDGTDWVNLFENGSSTLQENSWVQEQYDFSAYADNNPNFQLRFGLGSTDGSGTYSGWNVDEIEIKGYGHVGTPQLAFSVEEITDSIQPGELSVTSVDLYNNGDGTLRAWFSCDDPWVDFPTDMQVIPPGEFATIDVTLNSAPLTCGTMNNCNLSYTSNDNSALSGDIPIALYIYAPDIAITETSIDETVTSDVVKTHPIIINNNDAGRLFYQVGCQMYQKSSPVAVNADATRVITAAASPIGFQPADGDKSPEMEPFFAPTERSYGGPDNYGYNWVDSDEPGGPTFGWVDISTIGTELTLGDDEAQGPFPIGFTFPFYDSVYTECYVGSNGIVTFDAASAARTNTALPSTGMNSLICGWWDDIDLRKSGTVYYYYDASSGRFIVSFVNAALYYSTTGAGSLTFQMILYPDGKVQIQYGVMDPGTLTLNSGTVGIQNSNGDDGLTVTYNAAYMHDDLAIEFGTQNWLSSNPTGGVIEPFSSAVIDLQFDAAELEDGLYSGMIVVSSNDPDYPAHQIAVSMTVASWICLDIDNNTEVNIADLVYLVDYSFNSGPPPPVTEAADVDADGSINIADVVAIVGYMFGGEVQPTCGL